VRWAILSLALLLGVAGLLYRGGVAFVSTLSGAVASLGTDGPATATDTIQRLEAPTPPTPSPADPIAASGMPQTGSSSGPQPAAVLSTPESEQRAFKSRRALETINPRELVRR